MAVINVQFPEKLQFLFEPHRYKIAYGGRSGTKSWGFARALLLLGAQRSIRVACCREIQKSIDDSVHELLKNQIEALGLSSKYKVLNTEIVGRNGTRFSFHGLKFNPDNIKSLEGADYCWIEEAQAVTNTSWNKLIPTIRKPRSEIWISFNPELEEDPTYQRFVVKPPTGAKVVYITYHDNPFLSKESLQDIQDAERGDPDEFQNIWEGRCKKQLEGAVFGSQLRQAEDRIMSVPYTPTLPVSTFWDLGFGDATAIWFVQKVGFEWRVIDYLEDNQKTLAHYIQQLQAKGYVYDTDWLPHDAKHKTLAGAGQSLESQAIKLGRKVRIIPQTELVTQIDRARTIFPTCYFDREKCSDGLHALRHYKYKVDPETKQFSKEPLHDWASHGASAFMGFAISAQDKPLSKPKRMGDPSFGGNEAGWMGS